MDQESSGLEDAAGFRNWVNAAGQGSDDDLEGYFGSIAKARFVLRRVFRIFNEEAKVAGLEGLQHQALIQIAGYDVQSGGETVEGLPVGQLSKLLDVPLALASRLVAQLAEISLVERSSHPRDRRVTVARPTSLGREMLARISQGVHIQMRQFQRTLSDEERRATLMVLTFQLGIGLDEGAEAAIETLLAKVKSPDW